MYLSHPCHIKEFMSKINIYPMYETWNIWHTWNKWYSMKNNSKLWPVFYQTIFCCLCKEETYKAHFTSWERGKDLITRLWSEVATGQQRVSRTENTMKEKLWTCNVMKYYSTIKGICSRKILNSPGNQVYLWGESSCPDGSEYVWQRGVESLQGRVILWPPGVDPYSERKKKSP